MLPDDVSPVPVEALHMIRCSSASAGPCSTGRCSCVVAQMSFSMFCTCHAGVECSNVHTRTTLSQDDENNEHYYVEGHLNVCIIQLGLNDSLYGTYHLYF